MLAQLMQAVGIDQVMSVDIHADQLEGFFQIPMDALTATPLLCAAIQPTLSPGVVVVSPDVGRVAVATDYARRLGTSVVVLHKHRESATQTTVTHVVGDVAGRSCLIIDDMISTGGTIARAIEALLGAGARPEMTIAATHGVFTTGAREALSHPSVRGVYVTDTIPVNTEGWERLHVVVGRAAAGGGDCAGARGRLTQRSALEPGRRAWGWRDPCGRRAGVALAWRPDGPRCAAPSDHGGMAHRKVGER